MLLREYLKEWTKEDLLNEARSYELKNCSRLKKDDLIDRIVEYLTTEETLRSRLSCLTKEQMVLFRKACTEPQAISAKEIMDGMQLYKYLLGSFEEASDCFTAFEEIAQGFSGIDDEAFRTVQGKKGWLMKCISFFIDYYEIAPLEILYELYKLKVKGTIEEMIEMLQEMPEDITESCIFPMEKLEMQDLPKENPLYSERGLYVHLPVFEEDGLTALLKQQQNKKFYIPSAQQLDEICQKGYESSLLAYKELESYFIRKMGVSYEQAVSWCLQVWDGGYKGQSPADLLNKMHEDGFEFQGEQQMGEFLRLLMDAFNNTRTKENRGNKPWELSERGMIGGMPAMVPEMAQAASVSAKKAEKIYPNDPCPCGSGKKYKKCCGKN